MNPPRLLLTLLACLSALHAVEPGQTQQLTSAGQTPEGLAKSDWQSIRAAHTAWKHGFLPVEGGWQARNPGQQWTARFDGRGFLTQPREGDWQWGLELVSYGRGGQQAPVSGRRPTAKAEGQRLSYQWDATLQEWWVNDTRGLEHGYTLAQRPPGAEGAPLELLIATRGTLQARVADDALGVHFMDVAGATVLNYSGLKVTDADGQTLASRFEAAGEGRVRLRVEESAARYPVTIDPVAQQAYLKAGNNGPPSSDQFGVSVAVSDDTVIVGAGQEDSSSTGVNGTPDESAPNAGAAYVFTRSAGVWTQQAYLKPAAVGSTQAGDFFGNSVAVSGDTVVVGAPFEDGSTTGVNSTPNENAANAGAAYVFTRSAGVWTQQAYLKPAAVGTTQAGDLFGLSVAVWGDTVVVGAQAEDSSMTGVNSAANESAPFAGAAYVFTRSADVWTQEAYLKPTAVGTTQAGDRFGCSVAVSGDTVVVGAFDEDSSSTGVNGTPNENAPGAGTAYVFTRSAGAWIQQGYLKPAAVGAAQANDLFGSSVAVSGDTVVVGARWEDSGTLGVNSTPDESAFNAGAAYVFTRSAGIWTQQAYLKPAAGGAMQAGDGFGTSIAVSGDTVVVGAHFEGSSTTGVNSTPNQSAPNSGAAYVFTRSAGLWIQRAYLKPANVGTTQAGDQFGHSVAVSGETIVVGAYLEDSGTTGVNSTPNESVTDAGAAYVFTSNEGVWTQQTYLKASNTPTPGSGESDFFGSSVAVSGDTVVVGAPREDSSTTGVNGTSDEIAPDAGAAYVFTRGAGVWTQQAYLKPASVGTTQAGDLFGSSVAVSGDIVVIGAPSEDSSKTGVNRSPDEGALAAGAAYIFTRSAGAWSQQAYLKPATVGTTQANDHLGVSVAVSGETVVVGASGEDSSTTGINSMPDESANAAGAGYVFTRGAGGWTQQAYLKPAVIGSTQEADFFGTSVAVSGDTAVVGAQAEDSSTTGVNSTPNESALDAGAAYVFTRTAGLWTQQTYLKPAAVGTRQDRDGFGSSVAVSGDTVIVGASGEDSSTTGVNNTQNESATDAGAAYVFTRSAGVWAQQAYFKPAAVGTTQADDFFGTSVAVSGETVVVGAHQEGSSTTGVNSTPNESAPFAGTAYVFTRNRGVWMQQAYLKAAAVGTTQVFDAFGISVAISGDTVVVGAGEEDSSTADINSAPNETTPGSGAAYIFTISNSFGEWQMARFTPAELANPAISGDLADPNGNGFVNLLEYAVGGEPKGPSTVGRPQLGSSGDSLTFTFSRDAANTDLIYTVQGTDTLGTPWTDLAQSAGGAALSPLAPGITFLETGAGSQKSVTLTDAVVIGDPAHPRRFLRLEVSR